MSGLVDEDTAPVIGNQYGAQYLLMGSIIGVTTRRSETTVVGAGTKRAQVTATVSLRLVDTETGEVVLAATGRSRKNNTLVKAPPSTMPSTARAAFSRAWTARQSRSADACVLCL